MMRNLEVALCDSNEDYILKFASYLMEELKASLHIFTTTESFFSDEGEYDVAIISEDFEEIAEFRPKGCIKHKYFLRENNEDESTDSICKYQSMDNIINSIKEFRQMPSTNGKKSKEKSKLIGVYSPMAHELSLPFSMALGQAYRTKGRVLFLDLEELSIMPDFTGRTSERNLMDLLYDISTNTSKIDLSEYVKNFMGFDYVEPFLNPNEIGEIDSDTWKLFFEMLINTDYDVIVILFGRAINGFGSFLEKLEKLFVLGKPGDYFKKGQEAFLDYIDRSKIELELENVILPMSAKNLTDGAYQLEELLQGNLGLFVKKLMNMNGQNEYYG